MKEDKHLRATAYHEAGHAFADWHFGFKVKKATIVPKGDAAGHVVSKTGLHFRSLEYTNPSGARIGRFHDRVVSMLAGQAAQRCFSPDSVQPYHASNDHENVAALLSELHAKEEMTHVIRYLEAKAKNLVENPMHWRVVQHLAKSLMKHRTLTGEQVEAAIRDGFARQMQSRQKSKAAR